MQQASIHTSIHNGYEAELGSAVRRLRLRREMTLEELADRASLAPSSVRALELGRGSTLSTFIKVLDALGERGALEQWAATQMAPSPLEALRESRNQKPMRQRAPRRRAAKE